jgi:hypothetical protein
MFAMFPFTFPYHVTMDSCVKIVPRVTKMSRDSYEQDINYCLRALLTSAQPRLVIL